MQRTLPLESTYPAEGEMNNILKEIYLAIEKLSNLEWELKKIE